MPRPRPQPAAAAARVWPATQSKKGLVWSGCGQQLVQQQSSRQRKHPCQCLRRSRQHGQSATHLRGTGGWCRTLGIFWWRICQTHVSMCTGRHLCIVSNGAISRWPCGTLQNSKRDCDCHERPCRTLTQPLLLSFTLCYCCCPTSALECVLQVPAW